MEGQDEVSAREQHFHSQVRESTVSRPAPRPRGRAASRAPVVPGALHSRSPSAPRSWAPPPSVPGRAFGHAPRPMPLPPAAPSARRPQPSVPGAPCPPHPPAAPRAPAQAGAVPCRRAGGPPRGQCRAGTCAVPSALFSERGADAGPADPGACGSWWRARLGRGVCRPSAAPLSGPARVSSEPRGFGCRRRPPRSGQLFLEAVVLRFPVPSRLLGLGRLLVYLPSAPQHGALVSASP